MIVLELTVLVLGAHSWLSDPIEAKRDDSMSPLFVSYSQIPCESAKGNVLRLSHRRIVFDS